MAWVGGRPETTTLTFRITINSLDTINKLKRSLDTEISNLQVELLGFTKYLPKDIYIYCTFLLRGAVP